MRKKRWRLGKKNPFTLLSRGKKKTLCFDISIRFSFKPGLSHETVMSFNMIET